MPQISLFCPQGHRAGLHGPRARFCAACGTLLIARCERCQAALAPGATRCPTCDGVGPAQQEAPQPAAQRDTLEAGQRPSARKPTLVPTVLITAAVVAGLALSGVGVWQLTGLGGGNETVSLALASQPKEAPPSPPGGGAVDLPEETDGTGELVPIAASTPRATPPAPTAGPAERPQPRNTFRSTSFRVPLTLELPAGWQVSSDAEYVIEVEAGEDSPYFRTAWLTISYVSDASSGAITPEAVIQEVIASSEGALEPLAPPGPATLFGGPAFAIDMRAPQDVKFVDGFLGGHQFFAGERLHFVAGQTGTSYVLVYAEGQTSQWDALWPLFRAMIGSISAG